MNRKDTILVAVLVNVGVLLILFISSLKPHTQQEWQAIQSSQESSQEIQSNIARVEPQKPLIKQEHLPKEFSQAIDELLKSEENKIAAVEPEKESIKAETPLMALEVKSGDILGKIAKTSGTSVEEIKKINHLPDDKLQPGQTLLVPQTTIAKNTQAQPKSEIKPISNTDDRYYTVKNGDNPWTIATKNHIKVEELLRLNGLDEAKAKKIKPGDRLRIK